MIALSLLYIMNTGQNIEALLPISNNNGSQAVNARDLHAFLGSKQEFSNWIKNRIDQYGFVENQDYQVFDNSIKNSQGGRPSTEYALSINMAKELSMVERNEKGKTARKYFIACEEKLKTIATQFQIPQSFSEALMLAARQAEQIEQQQKVLEAKEQKIKEDKPKVLFADAVVAAENSILIGKLANILKQNGIKIGQNRLFEWMRNKGYLCKFGEKYNQPTQYSMELGLFEVTYNTVVRADKTFQTITTKVTGKGQMYFVNKFLSK